MARAVDLEESFGFVGGGVDFPAELERQNGILTAMNNQNGNADYLESSLRVELTSHRKRRAGENAKNNFRESGGRRKWSFEDYGADLVLRG